MRGGDDVESDEEESLLCCMYWWYRYMVLGWYILHESMVWLAARKNDTVTTVSHTNALSSC